MSLFPAAGCEAVLGWLLNGLQWLQGPAARPSGKSPVGRARTRPGKAKAKVTERKAASKFTGFSPPSLTPRPSPLRTWPPTLGD